MPSLWTPASWSERLAELEARAPELKTAPLRRDVRSLGVLLGVVLREQAGNALFDAVEFLRRTAIARREAEASGPGDPGDAASRSHLQQALLNVHQLTADPEAAYKLARAFSFYFELINLAETNHRKRRRLAAHQLCRLHASTEIEQAGAARLPARHASAPSRTPASHCLRPCICLGHRICVTPVFTAHPTEVARRSVMFKRRRISDLLAEQLDRIPHSASAGLERARSATLTG